MAKKLTVNQFMIRHNARKQWERRLEACESPVEFRSVLVEFTKSDLWQLMSPEKQKTLLEQIAGLTELLNLERRANELAKVFSA